MAVRTPSGKTLPGNLAIIPSEQSYVFYAIYQHAFPHLYSSEVCSRNCIVLTDEDKADYRSFEALIETTSDFKQSTVMRCTFHGVWMAFKKDLLTLLEDCDCGKVYGNFFIVLSISIYESFLTEFICNNSYLQPQSLESRRGSNLGVGVQIDYAKVDFTMFSCGSLCTIPKV
jgi:hypothetical protein